jgi:tetratricopeptide (TPR) repeat protein
MPTQPPKPNVTTGPLPPSKTEGVRAMPDQTGVPGGLSRTLTHAIWQRKPIWRKPVIFTILAGLLLFLLWRALPEAAKLRVRGFSATDFNKVASAHEQEGKYPEAEAEYRKAITLDPNNPYAHCGLGNVLYQQKNYGDAEAEYRKALASDANDSYPRDCLANLLYDQKNYPEAEAEFRKALAADPNDAYAHHGLGRLLYRQQDYSQAEAEYRKALAADPSYADARAGLGRLSKNRH